METIRIRPTPKADGGPECYLLRAFPPSRPDGIPSAGDWTNIRPGLVVGREPIEAGSMTVCDATMSRRHFRFSADGEAPVLDDLGSANGTYVNGKRVRSARLGPGDVIRAGSSLLLVCDRKPGGLEGDGEDGVVAVSAAMVEAVSHLRTIAPARVPVFLLGETGVGKDLLAGVLHKWSGRRGEFCAVNCAAMPETLVESVLFGSVKGSYTGSMRTETGWFRKADGGTLFLDELGEMPQHVQAKLNRVLEGGTVTPVGATESFQVDVRVVAATNRLGCLGSGDLGFRADLLARLEDEIVVIPPLRDRREDTVPLMMLAVAKEGKEAGSFDVSYVEQALIYSWPRNVRQLLKVVGAALRRLPEGGSLVASNFEVRGDWAMGTDSSPSVPALDPAEEPNLGLENVRAALAKAGGNVTAAARLLGINRRRMYRVMHLLGLDGKSTTGVEGDGV